MRAGRLAKLVAAALIAALPAATAKAADLPASLSGSIVTAVDRSPLAGAKLHVDDPKAGRQFASTPTSADGAFVLQNLPAATYRLAVEAGGGLYTVETPLTLAPGAASTVHLAVRPYAADETPPAEDDDDDEGGMLTFKDNPLTAALITVGIAVGIGFALDDDDSNSPPSPSAP